MKMVSFVVLQEYLLCSQDRTKSPAFAVWKQALLFRIAKLQIYSLLERIQVARYV